MLIKLLKAKIHRAMVTMTDADYHGSITIDRDLLTASGLLPNEAVTVADCENGNRFETYVIAGKPGSGIIGINGAAARLSQVGNRVIIMAFILATPDEAKTHVSKTILVNETNKVTKTMEQATQTS
jgi:aspartate 1-decarboxylase